MDELCGSQQQQLLHEGWRIPALLHCNAGALPSTGPRPLHHARRRSILLELFCHEAHVRINVMEEMLVSSAEVIEPILARRRLRKTVLGALAVAGETHIARSAIGGQSDFLGIAKARLLR
jgi:hypothetical protein